MYVLSTRPEEHIKFAINSHETIKEQKNYLPRKTTMFNKLADLFTNDLKFDMLSAQYWARKTLHQAEIGAICESRRF